MDIDEMLSLAAQIGQAENAKVQLLNLNAKDTKRFHLAVTLMATDEENALIALAERMNGSSFMLKCCIVARKFPV